jgi:hypothetical protein
MADTALDLVERVFPVGVPVRQWVCSLPWRLRALCGYDAQLCAAIVRAFVDEVSRSLRRRAKHALGLSSVKQAHTGCVTFIQRFDSALRLNVHTHNLFLDGVYVRDGASDTARLVFHELGEPSAEQVADIAHRTAERIKKILKQHGREPDPAMGEVDVGWAEPGDLPGAEHPALTACYGAAAAGTDLFGQRAGAPSLRLVDPSQARPTEAAAIVQGINVHAKVAISGHDRARLEKLCRYLARPPIAQDRLTRLSDGRLRYELKKVWKDGTRAIVLDPLDLIARIVAIIPPPKFHMIRYYGALGSGATLRSQIVPEPAPLPTNPVADTAPSQLCLPFGNDDAHPQRDAEARRRPWAWLLRHVFVHDVSTCERCGGPMRWLQVATEPAAIAMALADHGLVPMPQHRQQRIQPSRQQLGLGFS